MKGPVFSIRGSAARRGFTLAELLAVIIIMSILMVTVVPSIKGMTQGASLRGATMQVRTSLIAARQNAITKRLDTCVLFPSADQDPAKGYHAIAIYSTNYVTDWIFFPQGVYFQINNLDKPINVDLGGSSAMVTNCLFDRHGERANATAGNITLVQGFLSGTTVTTNKASGCTKVIVQGVTGIVQVKNQ